MGKLLPSLLLLALLVPSPAGAWGFVAHKAIAERAIALLPPELRPLFERHRTSFVERAIDPDTWRTAGVDSEPPNHFVDIDWEGFGPYPFNGLPRDLSAAIAKFGRERIEQQGLLPWRTEEMYGELRRAFEAYPRRGAFGQYDIVMFAAWVAHYASDAHVPLHGITNYDGQLTQQWGVHSRWEGVMFERFQPRLTIAPKAIAPVRDPRTFIFDRLLEDTQLAPVVLKGDLDAIGTKDAYDDTYYTSFFASNQTVMERRFNESVAAVAAMITGAWEAAGKPAIVLDPPATPQRRRRQ
jgi:hypothetical protein